MITAKNYAAQAEKSLSEVFVSKCFPEDVERLKDLFIDKIQDCVHFALPDGGIIFDDRKKGITKERVRLPFKNITVEYYTPKAEDEEEDPNSTIITKHLIFATEMTIEEMEEHFPDEDWSIFYEDDIWIHIFTAGYSPYLGFWVACPLGWAMPSLWDANINNDDKNIGLQVNGYGINLMLSEREHLEKTYGFDSAKEDLLKDISSEVSALLELCEALSCSNVKHEVIQTFHPNINQRRIRDGKTPFYETRTLWIDVPGGSKDSGDHQGGTHRSPRQHLRRGHIRVLQSGKKVWVNAAVVGAKENGIIKKDYAIKEAA
jgi:hypothetical protein